MDEERAIVAARKGADLMRPSDGEDVNSTDLAVARRWIFAYGQLVQVERALLDSLSAAMSSMTGDAVHEAQETNVPILLSQIERFEHRLDFWRKRKQALDAKSA